MGKHLNRHLDLRLDFQFCPQIAHADNQILQHRHVRFRAQINLCFLR